MRFYDFLKENEEDNKIINLPKRDGSSVTTMKLLKTAYAAKSTKYSDDYWQPGKTEWEVDQHPMDKHYNRQSTNFAAYSRGSSTRHEDIVKEFVETLTKHGGRLRHTDDHLVQRGRDDRVGTYVSFFDRNGAPAEATVLTDIMPSNFRHQIHVTSQSVWPVEET